MTCTECGREGHNRSTCPKIEDRKSGRTAPAQRSVTCGRCGRNGHNQSSCNASDIYACSKCGLYGHNSRSCY